MSAAPPPSTVHKLHEAGHSWRSLARALGCSASLLRRLDRLAQASPIQKIVAEQGGISTRGLLRVLDEQDKRRADQIRQANAQKRDQEAEAGARILCRWLADHGIVSAHGENIIDETRRTLAENEADGTLAQIKPAPPGTPLEVILARTRPRPSPPGVQPLEENSIPFYIEWLAHWAFYAFPDPALRDRALRLALDYQIRGLPPEPGPRRK